MPQSDLDRQKLLSGLEQDVAQAQQTVTSGTQARGIAPPPPNEPSSFAPRAIRHKGIVFGEQELAASQKQMKSAVDEILRTTQFANDQQREGARMEITKRFNQFQLQLLKKSAELEARMRQAGYDQETKQAQWKMYMGAIKGVTTGAVASAGRGSAPSGTPGNMTADQRSISDAISAEQGTQATQRAADYDRYRGGA